MENELQTNLDEILLDKETNLLPENLKEGVTVLGVEGSLKVTGLDSNIKLFETIEDMNNDPNPKEDDLAVVYREEMQPFKEDTETQFITFPEQVILDEPFTNNVNGMIISVDPSVMFDGQVRLSQSMFDFNGYSETGMIRVRYQSEDGKNYTRTEFMTDSEELTNPVDLGTIVKWEPMEPFNDVVGKFMLAGGNYFEGLYKYDNYSLEGIYCNSYGANTELNDIPYLSPNISRPDEVGYDYNIIVVTDSHLDVSGLYKVIDKCKVLWYGGGYGKDAVYNGKQGILVTLYEPSYAESSSTNLNLVLEEYDFTVSTNPTSKQIIRDWDDISIFPSPIYVAQLRSSSSEPYTIKWYFTSYENADYTGNGHAASYKHTIYSVPSDITLPISSAGYGGKPEGITTKDGAYYYTNIYTNRYEPAPNQYTLTEPNQLLENISAYGKNGNVTGDGSICTPNNTFADIPAQLYYNIKKQYDVMTPKVLTDDNKTIDKNIYFVPVKSNGTPLLDTSNVTNMSHIFVDCTNLQTISKLNTSNVTNMNYMFSSCTNLINIPQLNTSNVTDMGGMFVYCANLINIPQLDTSNVTNMGGMFRSCKNILTIPELDTSNVTNMSNMFVYCTNLINIPQLNTSNVTDMSNMFSNCQNLATVPSLDTSKVTNMNYMFSRCTSLTNIPNLNTSNATRMYTTFGFCSNLISISNIDTSNVTNMASTFVNCQNLATVPLLDTTRVNNMYRTFGNCRSLTNDSLNNILYMCSTSNITNTSRKTLEFIGLTQDQANICMNLSNYQNFINSGWTTGY